MGKAKELLGLIASITEEGEGQGPLNLMAGAKVKFMKDGADMVGEICPMEGGGVYDQANDSYCVKVGDQVMMIKSSDLSIAETKAAKQRPGRPNPYKKTQKPDESNTNEDDAAGGSTEPPGPVDGPAAPAADALSVMKEACAYIKEALDDMHGMVDGDKCPSTKAMIGEMMASTDGLVPQYEEELNLPGDGGGAGVGGNQQDDGGNGTPA